MGIELDLSGKGNKFNHIFGIPAHNGSIKAISSSLPWLITGSTDESIRIYNYKKLKEFGALFKHRGTITAMILFKSIFNNWC